MFISNSHLVRTCALLLAFASVPVIAIAAQGEVTFAATEKQVAVYDVFEATINMATPVVGNPFTEAKAQGIFTGPEGKATTVKGFADSQDGRTFRVRYMPSTAGTYGYKLSFQAGAVTGSSNGSFQAKASGLKGPIRVDPNYPWHFIWEGTGEHYFFNGTTAFWLLGWKDDRTIQFSIARLARMKVNRLRVLLSGRTSTFYGDAVMNGESDDRFDVFLSTWPAEHLKDFSRPNFDYSRFDVDYWQRFDRTVRFARDRNVTISVILDIVDSQNHIKQGSEEEKLYLQYAIARLSAFSNITWDLGDDCDTFHDDKWTHDTGTMITSTDPVHHLATSHPVHAEHQDISSDWFGFTSFQDWTRKQHEFILKHRELQKKAGRIIPQTNEEYGYEDHYPLWAEGPGSESADTLRRTAWEIYMAGGYQTAGETARRGTNVWPDTGGGWINGRGDDTMTMFLGYGHIVDFFTSFDWWKAEPHDELVDNGSYCLSELGKVYAIYVPRGGSTTVQLQPGKYSAAWFSPQTGELTPLPTVEGGKWTSPDLPKLSDWALLLKRIS